MRLVDLVTCPECKKTYVQKNVYRHLWEQHGWAREDCRLLVSLIKTGKKKLTTVLQSETYSCGKCNVVYYSRTQLEGHFKTCLADVKKTEQAVANLQQLRAERLKFSERFRSTSITCPVCHLVCGTQECFVKHCCKNHATDAQPFTLEDHSFKDMESFKIWFDRRQEDTCTSLTKRTGHAGETFYRCHMVGKYSSVATKRKSNTRKLDQCCTAHLKVYEQADGTIFAMGCFSHIGHELNHKLLWLTDTQEKYIRELIDYGMSADQIYYHIKEQYEHYECKLKYISKNDIRNISVRYKKEQVAGAPIFSRAPKPRGQLIDYTSPVPIRQPKDGQRDHEYTRRATTAATDTTENKPFDRPPFPVAPKRRRIEKEEEVEEEEEDVEEIDVDVVSGDEGDPVKVEIEEEEDVERATGEPRKEAEEEEFVEDDGEATGREEVPTTSRSTVRC